MNKETRIQKIQEIIKRDKNKTDILRTEIPWEGSLMIREVYNIPLEYLVYNKYNGRILSRTKSLEKQKHQIDVESEEGKELVEKLLWESNEGRNKTTLESIGRYGQEKIGIITKDGIIIDGNRRAMLLGRNKKDHFKAVVLDVTLEENPLEIERLETTYQMGEDEKVGYNATEKYIKSKLLYKKLSGEEYSSKVPYNKTAVDKIATWMGEDEGEILKYLDTMEVMDEYLEYLEYDGIYTQLDKREDQFLNLTKWLNNFYGEESSKAFDGYKNDDVDDLKIIAFHYIRTQYEGKEFRILAEGQKTNHFFGDKKIWHNFSKYHFDKVKDIQEAPIDYNSKDLKKHLDDRDTKFFENTLNEKGESFLNDNIERYREQLGYNKAAGEPEKLVSRAFEAINTIKANQTSFANPEVQNQLLNLSNKTFSLLEKKSPSRLLAQIITMLESIEIDKIPEDEMEEVRTKTKRIQQIGYKISKEL
jgi:hypothetical protein